MRRRDLIAGVAGLATAWPSTARTQQSSNKIPVVGVLWHAGSAEEEDVYLSVVRKAFNELGYIEGKNIILEHRFPAELPDRFRILARELVDAKPNAIIAVTTRGAVELKKLTNTIPVVVTLAADPVGFGLVESLARPGGNFTGLSVMTSDTSGKRLGLLKQAVPNLSRVALLIDLTDVFKERTIKVHQASAQAMGISMWPVEVATPEDIEAAIAKIAEDGADGIVRGTGSSMLFVQRARVAASALQHRLPVITYIAEEVPDGLLMSYGQDLPEFFRRTVGYVDKILKGRRAADLPVEQPTKFKLVLNQKTAKALGLTFPDTLLISADEVIE